MWEGEVFIKSFYNIQESKGRNISKQIDFKELLVEEIKPIDDPKYEIEICNGCSYEDSSRDILEHINKYFICLEKQFESLIILKRKEFDCLITWTSKIHEKNRIIYILESTNWCICKNHKLGVRVDYRFRNIINSIFPENKHKNCFLNIDEKFYFNYSSYIILNQGEETLKQLKDTLTSEYVIF